MSADIEFVEYGRLNSNRPGHGLEWLAEPRGRAFATHQRTVRVTYGQPEPIAGPVVTEPVVDAQVYCGDRHMLGIDCTLLDGHVGPHHAGNLSW